MKNFEITETDKELVKMRIFYTYYYYYDRMKIDEKYFNESIERYNDFLNEHAIEYTNREENEMWKVVQIIQINELKYRALLMVLVTICEMFEQFLIDILVTKLELKNGLSFGDAISVFNNYGFDIKKYNNWKKLKELRLLVNVIKHADGNSRTSLEKIRRDIFSKHNSMIGNSLNDMTLNISEKDLDEYFCEIIQFLNDMPSIYGGSKS